MFFLTDVNHPEKAWYLSLVNKEKQQLKPSEKMKHA